jgi:hypothetical protein
MKKRLFLMAVVGTTALTASGITAAVVTSTAGASGAKERGMVGFQGVPRAQVASASITPGSTWTYYEEDNGPSPGAVICEVLTFASGTFTGDKGDAGTYTSSSKKATLDIETDPYFASGKFTGTYETADAEGGFDEYGGSFKISDTRSQFNKETYGPDALVARSDPYQVGGC